MDTHLTQTLQALADPTRRSILEMLQEGDKNAGEIAAQFQISAPSVSHHLSVLRGAGLVLTRRSGQQIIYRLNTSVLQEIMQQLMGMFGIGATPRTTSQEDRYDTSA